VKSYVTPRGSEFVIRRRLESPRDPDENGFRDEGAKDEGFPTIVRFIFGIVVAVAIVFVGYALSTPRGPLVCSGTTPADYTCEQHVTIRVAPIVWWWVGLLILIVSLLWPRLKRWFWRFSH
jgi:hypothetical protein